MRMHRIVSPAHAASYDNRNNSNRETRSMKSSYNFAARLTGRLEMYINLVVVPLAVYFAFATSEYQPSEMILLGVMAGISAVIMTIAGTIFRFARLSRIQSDMDDDSADPVRTKLAILRYPRIEFIIISIRWVIGIMLCHFLMTLITEMSIWRTITFILAAIMCLIVNGTINYFATENFLSRLLYAPRMAGTTLFPGAYRTLGIARRLLMAVFAVNTIPFIIMGYLLYLLNAQVLKYAEFRIHLGIIMALSAVTMGVLIFEASRGMRRGLKRTIDSLTSLERGDYDSGTIPILDRSEIGIIAHYINVLAKSFSEYERKNIELNRALTDLNMSLSRDAALFSQNTTDQASAMEEIVSTTEEIAAGADSVVIAMDEQSGSMELQGKSMGELSSVIGKVTSKIESVLRLAHEIENTSQAGNSTLGAMIESLKKVSDSSAQMTSIIEIINDISDKINLLSLNASIEAARAGEAGRGFAVVADEVSKLADMTANSIKDISGLVRANIDEIRTGMKRIDETASTIGGISGLVESINESLREVSEQIRHEEHIDEQVNKQAGLIRNKTDMTKNAMSEQKYAIDEIVKTVTVINQSIQGMAESAAHLSLSASQAERMASALLEKKRDR
jgi:methyl-accepting chemotaxis protein